LEAVNAISGERCNPHPRVFSDRVLRPGDPVYYDILHSYMGYRTCYYRCFSIGYASHAMIDAYKRCREYLDAAISLVKPGRTTAEIAAVWPKAQEFGFPDEEAAFALQFGHGIGLAIWEKPVISRLVSLEHSHEIKPGMVFALETFWPSTDGWSAARIEEEIVVTETGHEVITRFPADQLMVAGAHYFTVNGLIGTFYLTSIVFVLVVLGFVAWLAGFSVIKFLFYTKEEVLLVLAISSSEPAIPTLMAKLEKLGCSKALVGLIVPTGYTFTTDGSAIYMSLAALFFAQATNTPLTLGQQLTIFAVALLTSKGVSGVQGASFIALVATLTVIPTIPVAGMALILGIDRFMSMFRALINMIGNGAATLVVARWERELSREALQQHLAENSRSALA
jgi:hypothetical protein